jgi:outer membrane protein assembly factor BamB
MFRHFRSSFLVFVKVVAAAVLFMPSLAFAATDVLTWHNDLARTGLNPREWSLTPGNVNATDFGKLFVANFDGQIYGQPLIVSRLQIPGQDIYNVLYVATEHDSVYAIDADTGVFLWRRSLLAAGETPADTDQCDNITPEVGITATPVIDRRSGPHGTIYVVTMSRNAAGFYFQRLHALDLATGTEEFGGPVEVLATYPGTGSNSSNGNVIFDPVHYLERAGLALSNGVVYTTWTSHGDCTPYTSWVIGYDEHTLAQVRVLNLTHNGYQGAIWQSGGAPAIDSNGFLYAFLGNGRFEVTLDANGFPIYGDFGNCFVKLSTANNSLQVADYWTMFNTVAESQSDTDLSSGGPMLLPDMRDATGTIRRLAVGSGKDAHIYIANRDNMGKFNPNSNLNLYQELPGSLGGFNFSTPAFFNGRLYFGAVRDVLRAFSFTNARMNGGAVSRSANVFPYPGISPSISANGTAHGILWAAENVDPAVLHAYDASDLSRELYNSNQAPNSRDHFGSNAKFSVPTVANGKVYVATTGGTMGAFGLFNPPRLANLSGQAYVGLQSQARALTGGFVVHGTGHKQVVLRALGPSLQLSTGNLQNPMLELYDRNGTLIASNDDWATDVNAGQVQAAGLAPSDPRESALARTLTSGSYTVVVRGVNNTTGTGRVDMYDLSLPPAPTLANMSVRSLIAGAHVLLGDVTITGRASQTVLFRAIGPDLISQGVAFALRNPTLALYDENWNLIAGNVYWRSDQQAAIESTGLAPGDDRDAAILANLQPGHYHAIVQGWDGSVGIAQLEAHAVLR